MPERDLTTRMQQSQQLDGNGRRSAQIPEEVLGQVRAHPGLLAFGLAGLALGALAWYYLGPDLKRYLKVKSM